MPGGGDLLGRGAAGGPGTLQAAQRRACQAVAGDHGEEGRAGGRQGVGRQAGQAEAARALISRGPTGRPREQRRRRGAAAQRLAVVSLAASCRFLIMASGGSYPESMAPLESKVEGVPVSAKSLPS